MKVQALYFHIIPEALLCNKSGSIKFYLSSQHLPVQTHIKQQCLCTHAQLTLSRRSLWVVTVTTQSEHYYTLRFCFFVFLLVEYTNSQKGR